MATRSGEKEDAFEGITSGEGEMMRFASPVVCAAAGVAGVPLPCTCAEAAAAAVAASFCDGADDRLCPVRIVWIRTVAEAGAVDVAAAAVCVAVLARADRLPGTIGYCAAEEAGEAAAALLELIGPVMECARTDIVIARVGDEAAAADEGEGEGAVSTVGALIVEAASKQPFPSVEEERRRRGAGCGVRGTAAGRGVCPSVLPLRVVPLPLSVVTVRPLGQRRV